jgi:membrane protein required for colicin V production
MILDIVAGTILFLSMLIAWFRGFIRETLTILGLIGSSIAALLGAPYAAPYVLGWFPNEKDADGNEPMLMGMIPYDVIAIAVSYLLVFVIVYIILSLCSHWLAKTAKEAGLGALDRSIGLIFGLIRAVILIGFLFIPFNLMLDDEGKDEWFGDSMSLEYVDYTSRIMGAAITGPLGKGDDASEKDDRPNEKEDDSKSKSPLDILKNKALESKEETLELLKKQTGEELKKKGYTDEQRDALESLFDNAVNPELDKQNQ